MLVVDASCAYDLLVLGPRSRAASLLIRDTQWVAPHCMPVEVMGALRRNNQLGRIDDTLAGLAIADLASWPGRLFGHEILLRRAWDLRHNVSTWDAQYVALAEILECPLITLDLRLAEAAPCEVLVP